MAAKGVGGLFFSLSASLARWRDDMNKAKAIARSSAKGMSKGFNSARKSSMGLSRSLVGLKSAIVAFAGPAVIGSLIKRSIDAADAIAKTADKVGLTTDALQELQHAANLSGVSQDTLNMAMQRFSRRIGEAANGTGELLGVVEDLGVNLRDSEGRVRSNTDVLSEFANIIQNTESEQERLRIAFKLFDSEGAALVNMLKDGSAGLDEMRMEARNLGLVLDEQLLRDAEEAKDELSRLSTVVQRNLYASVLQILPALTDFAEKLTGLATKSSEASARQKLLAEAIQSAGIEAKESPLYRFFSSVIDFVQRKNEVGSAFADIVDGLDAIQQAEPQFRFVDDVEGEARKAVQAGNIERLGELWGIVSEKLKTLSATNRDTAETTSTLNAETLILLESVRGLAPAVASVTAAERMRIATYDQIIARQQMLRQQQQLQPEAELQTQGLDADPEMTLIEQRMQAEQAALGERTRNYEMFADSVMSLSNNLLAVERANIEARLDRELQANDNWYTNRRNKIEATIKDEERRTEAIAELEADYRARRENIEARAMRAQERLSKRFKNIKIAQALTNTALAVTKTLSQYPYPINTIFAGIVAAAGAAQVAAIRAQPYAKGGIIDSPVMFPDRGGMGLAGEAGPEAILPLKRTPTGDLGVQVSDGGGETVNNFYFTGNVMDEQYFMDVVAPKLERLTRKGLYNPGMNR